MDSWRAADGGRWLAAVAVAVLAQPQDGTRAPPPREGVYSILAHLDDCTPDEGFPNASRRFLLTGQSADRNDGDARLRLWLPPSGSLRSGAVELQGPARLELGIGCEIFDAAWPVEGAGEPAPPVPRIVTEFTVEWIDPSAATAPLLLGRWQVLFDPAQASAGRVRQDLTLPLEGARRGVGELRFRARRIEGPATELVVLPTLWSPRLIGAVRPGQTDRAAGTNRRSGREEVVFDLLEPAAEPRRVVREVSSIALVLEREIPVREVAPRVALGRVTEGGIDVGPFERPAVALEGHFQAGAGNHVPRGGTAPALAFAESTTLRMTLPPGLPDGCILCFEMAFAEIGDQLGAGVAELELLLDDEPLWTRTLQGPMEPAAAGWSETVRVAIPAAPAGSADGARILEWRVILAPLRAPRLATLAPIVADDGAVTLRTVTLARPWFGIGRPRLVRPLATAPSRATAAAPNVLFICIETLRADEVGFGSGTRETTPFLTGLADRALVFSRAISPAPWTLPSVASYLTGLRPTEHGARSELEDILPERWTTLAEAAASRGLRTFAAVTNGLLRVDNGFAAGFDTFATFSFAHAAQVRQLFLDWQGEQADDRFFAWLHLFEPHVPLNAPGWMREHDVPPELRGRPYAKQESEVKRTMQATGVAGRAADALAFLRGRYRGEIRYCDAELALLCAELARRGVLENTVLIVTSDHGEEFGDHRWFGHGSQLFEESIHVPLVVRGPGVPAGIVEAPVEALLASRIAAAALGQPGFGSATLPACSWPLDVAALDGALADHPVVSMTEKLIDVQSPDWPRDAEGLAARIAPRAGRVLRLGDRKAILARPPGAARGVPGSGEEITLFELDRDPLERAPTGVRWLDAPEAIFRRFKALLEEEARADPSIPSLDVAPSILEVLRANGYLDAGMRDR